MLLRAMLYVNSIKKRFCVKFKFICLVHQGFCKKYCFFFEDVDV